MEKLLEDTQIKLSVVISDIFGKSGRDMLEALIAGQRDPHVLARMARGTMRKKISVLQEALTGHFRDHHGYLLRMMLDRVDGLTAQIEALTGRIEEVIAPFARQVAQLDEITGVGPTGAQELIEPLERIARLFAQEAALQKAGQLDGGCVLGCPFGNLAVEMGTQDAAIRAKVDEVLAGFGAYVEDALREAQATGSIRASDVAATARAVIAYFEGVMLLAKAHNDAALIERLGREAIRLVGA